MKFRYLLLVLTLFSSGYALGQTYDSYGNSGYDPGYGNSAYDSGYGGQNPRPALSPYDKPTLGNPRPVIYPKEPTLGDPRPYRKTSPATCTSLLCD